MLIVYLNLLFLEEHSLHEQLKDNFNKVEECVGEIVNEYYQPFNENIRNFSNIYKNYNESKKTIVNLHQEIAECTDILENKRQNLKQLTFDRAKYAAIEKILGKLELISTSERELSNRLENKRYYGAVKFYNTVKDELYSVILNDITAINEYKTSWPEKKESIENTLTTQLCNYIFLRQGSLENLTEILSVTSIGILVESITESYETKCIESLNPQSIDMVLFLIIGLFELDSISNLLNHMVGVFRNELHAIVINELSNKKKDNVVHPEVYLSKLLPIEADGIPKAAYILNQIFNKFELILNNVKYLFIILDL